MAAPKGLIIGLDPGGGLEEMSASRMTEVDNTMYDDGGLYLEPSEERAFKRHVAGLNKLIREVRKRYPEAEFYLACSMGARLHILSGPSHDDGFSAVPRQDRIIDTLTLEHADGGDW